MTAVMFESQNVKMIRINAVVDGVWKAMHQVATDIFLDNAPAFGRFKEYRSRSFGFPKKLNAQRCYATFVVLRCFDQFSLRIGMVYQSHSTARRAARITSSCVRPATLPDESSSSR